MSSVALGALAGALHAVTGPDHMAVLLPSCIGRPATQTWLLGARWGLGHGLGAVLFGALATVLKDLLNLNVAAASHWLELCVGLTLLVIGGMGIRDTSASGRASLRRLVSGEAAYHKITTPDAAESGNISSSRSPQQQQQQQQQLPARGIASLGPCAAIGTGILHGFTGTGHLVGVLPALSMPSAGGAAMYLGGFCCGTLVAMVSDRCDQLCISLIVAILLCSVMLAIALLHCERMTV
jgi:nickel/cobalt transporter (NicO) family protein